MSLIPLNDTVTVVQAGSLDDWGRPTQGETLTLSCRIDYVNQKVRTTNGEEKLSKATIYFDGVANIFMNDTIKWSDGFGDHEEKPLSVSPLKDFSSNVLLTKVVV